MAPFSPWPGCRSCFGIKRHEIPEYAPPWRPRRSLKAPVKVALLVETSNAYARGLLRGIVSYIREHRLWSLYLSEHNRGDKPPRWLAHWKGHGIIARIENIAIAEALRQVSV